MMQNSLTSPWPLPSVNTGINTAISTTFTSIIVRMSNLATQGAEYVGKPVAVCSHTHLNASSRRARARVRPYLCCWRHGDLTKKQTNIHTCSHWDSWGHGEEVTGFREGTGPESHAVHWGGEGKDIPSTASLRSFTKRECCFSDGVCGGPVRAGPVFRVIFFLFVCLLVFEFYLLILFLNFIYLFLFCTCAHSLLFLAITLSVLGVCVFSIGQYVCRLVL